MKKKALKRLLKDALRQLAAARAPAPVDDGPTLLRTAGGKAIELSSLSARFHECIVATEGPDAYRRYEWPSLHEVRSLCGRTLIEEGLTPTQVQGLLGHKHAEMTALYLDDRGLTAAEWKTVEVSA